MQLKHKIIATLDVQLKEGHTLNVPYLLLLLWLCMQPHPLQPCLPGPR